MNTPTPHQVSKSHQGFRLSAAFLMATASAAVGMSWVLFAISRLNAGPYELGKAAAILQGSTIFFSWIFGKMADRIGHRILPVLSATGYGICAVLVSRAESMVHIYWLMLAFGIFLGAFWPSMEASFGANIHGKVLLASIGVFNLAWSTGVAVGPPLAGYLLTHFQNWAFYIPAIVAISSGTAILLLPGSNPEQAHSQHFSLNVPETANGNAFLYAGWVSNFGAWFLVGVLRAIFPKLAKSLGYSDTQIGILIFLWAIFLAVLFLILSRTERWTYRHTPLQVFQAIMIAGALIIYRASSFEVLALAAAVIGIGCGLTYTSSLFYALDGNSDKGAKAGIHEVVLGAGSLIGPYICGIAAKHYSLRTPYIICAGVVLLCMVAVSILLRGEPGKERA